MMEMDRKAYFQVSLSEAVLELFHDYGIECVSEDVLASRESAAPPSELASIVGFKGTNLRGGLAFVAPAELVARMLPVPHVEARREEQLRDWSGEMANQLAGRFKNKLSERARDFDVSAAVSFRGISVRFSALRDASGVSLRFTIGSVTVRVYLDCVGFDELAIGESRFQVVPEGEVVIF
jgi:CheY-specific phosphatase CheX